MDLIWEYRRELSLLVVLLFVIYWWSYNERGG